MKVSELKILIRKYFSLNQQVKKMSKLKKQMNEKLKAELIKRKIFKVKSENRRLVLDWKSRSYPNNPKIKKLIIDSGKKIGDYYKETGFYTLNIAEIDDKLHMEVID